MQLDARIGSEPSKAAHRAELLEAAGFDGVWISELVQDPFLGLAVAADHTQRVTLGTSIAVAFARNPMTTAYLGWGMQSLSAGRFQLGLGSLIKRHITRRFSMPWSRPAARMEEYIAALHAIWDAWDNRREFNFRGDFYQHNFTNPMFSPPPHRHGRPRVHLGAVGPLMTTVAGRVADGLICHSIATAEYLTKVAMPALQAGLNDAARPAGAIEITALPYVVAAATAESFERQARETRLRLANTCSTPAYRHVLELHGWEDAQTELLALSRQGRWSEMPEVIDDEMLRTFAAVGTPSEVADLLLARFGGVANRLIISTPVAHRRDEPDAIFADLSCLAETIRRNVGRPGE